MELQQKYINLLYEIHSADKERLTNKYVEQSRSRPSLKDDLKYLMNVDLVEFDTKDQSFYLTYEGYDEVSLQREIESRPADEEVKEDKYGDIKVIVGAVLLFIIAILMLIL